MTQQATLGAAGGQETTCTLEVMLEAEIAAAKDDVDRVAAMVGETRRVKKAVAERIERFRAALKQLEAEDAALAKKEAAELRILTQHRERLFNLETESVA